MNQVNCFLCDDPDDTNDQMCEVCEERMSNPSFLFCKSCQKICGLVDSGYIDKSLVLIPGERYKVESCHNCAPVTDRIKSLEWERYEYTTNLVHI